MIMADQGRSALDLLVILTMVAIGVVVLQPVAQALVPVLLLAIILAALWRTARRL